MAGTSGEIVCCGNDSHARSYFPVVALRAAYDSRADSSAFRTKISLRGSDLGHLVSAFPNTAADATTTQSITHSTGDTTAAGRPCRA